MNKIRTLAGVNYYAIETEPQSDHDSYQQASQATHQTYCFESETELFVYGVAGETTMKLTKQLQEDTKKPIHTIVSQGGKQNVSRRWR